MGYLATISTPGYLPWDDDPPVCDTAKEAWEYLLDRRREAEDTALEESGDGYSSTLNTMESLTNDTMDPVDAGLNHDYTGTIYGDTPGYDGDHDLGLAYTVTEVNEDGEPL